MKLRNYLLSTILIGLFFCSVNNSIAQPCSSINVIGSCSEIWSISLSGAGVYNSGYCFTTPGNEIIFEYTPTVTGTHSIDVSNITGFEYIDFGWKLASSGCSGTGWTCIDDVFLDGNYGAMNWTAGVTYYIIIDSEGPSAVTFDFQLNCPTVSTAASDCSDAVPICSDASFSIDPNGYGAIDEIPNPSASSTSNPNNPGDGVTGTGNSGCLLSGETNSTWMVINVLNGGTLEFSFGTYDLVGNFFDWAMWPYSPSACADIQGDALAPLRCNYNGTAVSLTGIASAANVTNMETVNGDTYIHTNFAPELVVGNNTQFIICFSNWSSAQTNVPLNFFGTADVSCSPLGVFDIDISGSKQGKKNTINWYVVNEDNAVSYAIERLSENSNWEVLGEKNVNQNEGALKQYSYTDETPLRGENYYRIKQYHEDGSIKESSIILIEQKIEGLEVLSAFPNPANNYLNIKYTTREAGIIELQITNLIGTTVYTENNYSVAGVSINNIDVSQLSRGCYFMQLRNKTTGENQTVRFVKE